MVYVSHPKQHIFGTDMQKWNWPKESLFSPNCHQVSQQTDVLFQFQNICLFDRQISLPRLNTQKKAVFLEQRDIIGNILYHDSGKCSINKGGQTYKSKTPWTDKLGCVLSRSWILCGLNWIKVSCPILADWVMSSY